MGVAFSERPQNRGTPAPGRRGGTKRVVEGTVARSAEALAGRPALRALSAGAAIRCRVARGRREQGAAESVQRERLSTGKAQRPGVAVARGAESNANDDMIERPQSE